MQSTGFLRPFLMVSMIGISLLGCTQSRELFDTRDDVSPDIEQQITQPPLPITHFPTKLDSNCLDGEAKLHDECGDQVDILNQAVAQAKVEDKHVLVIYGGEWCIWCHVLNNYFAGKFRTFDYEWRASDGDITNWSMREKISEQDIKDAAALNKYVANNFVVAHIEGTYTNGAEAIATTGFNPDEIYYAPFILVLNSQGQYAGNMEPTSAIEGFEVRKSGGQEFRGYNRQILLDQLKTLKLKASNDDKPKQL